MNMKKIFLELILIFASTSAVKSQQLSIPSDSIIAYLEEVKQATKAHEDLWNLNIYSSILLVNPQTRELIANEQDANGVLKKEGELYTGVLPQEINIGNTAIEWSGTRWAMFIMPIIPKEKLRRLTLFAHELFHQAQPSLGFNVKESNNSHLDAKEGRVYLRLELEALKASVKSSSDEMLNEHLTNAIAFRRYRNELFPNSETFENLMEINEGLAEYTGQMISEINKEELFFDQNISELIPMPTYVRSFGYKTIPAYGYLASKIKSDWNKNIDSNTNLIDYFSELFQIEIPSDLKSYTQSKLDLYGGNNILAEEEKREIRNRELLAKYKALFIDNSHLDIKLENMNFSFDPRNISPLENIGKVYSQIRIVDNWGILTATEGALISSNFKKVTVSKPTKTDGNRLEGQGWVLELNEGYSIIEKDRVYHLTKN